MTLSSLIVQREIATIREVEEALARQVLYGGDLVTNLLEVARLDEESVTPLLAESYGLPVGPIGEFPKASEEAKRLVPQEIASRRSMFPLGVEGGKLVIVVPNPLDRDAEKELSFALSLPVEQRIAPMVRVRQAIARDYGIPLERRLQRLVQRMAGLPSTIPGSVPAMAGVSAPAVKAPPAPKTGFSDTPVRVEAPIESPKAKSAPPPSTRVPRSFVQRHAPAPSRQQRRRRGPLPFELALKELEEASERDSILDLFFEFARQFFDYTVLFVVHHDHAEGREAFGDGASRDRVHGMSVPLDEPSVLSTARDHGDATILVPASEGVDAALWTDLQLTKRSPVLVSPVVVRHRVVALLMGDSGESSVEESAKVDVSTFAREVGQAFEKLIVKKKKHDTTRMEAVSHPIDTDKVPSVRPPPTSKAPPPTQASPSPPPPERAGSDPPTRPEPAVHRSPNPPAANAVARPAAARHYREPIVLTKSDQPPPVTVVQVRPVGGPPIPREDPADLRPRVDLPRRQPEPSQPPAPVRRSNPPPAPAIHGPVSEPPTRRHGRGALATDEVDRQDDTEEERSADAQARAPTIEEREIDDEEARALLAEIEGTPQQLPPVSKAAPSSDHAISIPAHKPPSKRSDPPKDLPSVIVDVDSEVLGLVDRFIADSTDDQAEAELLRLGGQAMSAIMARFPGPTLIKSDALVDPLPRVVDCGPVLRLIARQRRVALPFVLANVEAADPDVRTWATFLISELAYPEAADRLIPRLFDSAPKVRRVARAAARAVAEIAPAALVERLGKIALQAEATTADRVCAIDTLGDLREPLAVPVLIGALADSVSEVAAAARGSLMLVARQDFGIDARRWNLWWSSHAAKHRIEWLIDALDHDISGIRKAAGGELKALTKEFFGYADDLPKKDRERAQQRYRDWWTSEGRMRFRRM